ncbi:MAG: EamA family transporter [Ignavibacteriaceae bacterium]|nr:EamA family transporter [Ignavibacteriaceae bacterium]
MIFLLLTVFCSSGIALILRFSESKKYNPVLILEANYLFAAAFSLVVIIIQGNYLISIFTFGFGSLLGILFAVSFFSFTKAIKIAGTALATVTSRLSVISPVLLSILFYNEQPNLNQYFGFGLTILTIIFFYFALKTDTKRHLHFNELVYLVILLAGVGFNDFSMKVFKQSRPVEEESAFVFIIFFFAFLYLFIYSRIRRIKFSRPDFIPGVVLGIPNVLSTFFLLSALEALPAIFVYPVMNIGVIVITAVVAYLIWKEQINPYGKIALAVGIAAILLLKL